MTSIDRLKAFRLLGVDPTADFPTIKAAWRKMVRDYHPDLAKKDKVAANRRLVEINAAFELVAACEEVKTERKPVRRARPAPHIRERVAPKTAAPKPSDTTAVAIVEAVDLTHPSRLEAAQEVPWTNADRTAARRAQAGFGMYNVAANTTRATAERRIYA